MTFLRRSFTALLVSAALSGMASAQEAPATTPEDGAPAAAPAEPAAPAIGSQPAASGTVRSTHGSWSIVCESAPGAPTEQCALLQNVVADDRPEVGLTVIALKTADGNTEILRVLAPLGLSLIHI